MVVHKDGSKFEHKHFKDLLDYLNPTDLLVRNNTRVIARRLEAFRESGSTAEVLLLQPVGCCEWSALVNPGRKIRPGSILKLLVDANTTIHADVVSTTDDGGRILRFRNGHERDSLRSAGDSPLPPYIRSKLSNEERYQTVYSQVDGSAAAPTAGLHFTDEMLNSIIARKIDIADVTLHVGIDTFRPVKVEDIRSHIMHGEWRSISQEVASKINQCTGKVVAVGTTTVRTLESASLTKGCIEPVSGATRVFISPGYEFKIVDAILTNFHLPKSTLIMMISAFASRELILEAYAEAVKEKYRFFSFGDAMLIL